jgi:release factor glutamine methyltransferase
MLSTPDYSHLTSKDYEKVYEPLEDTFLFLDALEKEIYFLNDLNPEIVIEIGSGSGLVINFLAMHLKNTKNETAFFATDLNKDACLVTQRTCIQNNNDSKINILNCDFVGPLKDRLRKKIDILLFNPPYVVTEDHELGSKSIEAAWAGGLDGRQVMDRLFPQIDDLLSPNGVFYLVCIKQNKIDEIGEFFSSLGFNTSVVMNRKAGIEHLYILKINRI